MYAQCVHKRRARSRFTTGTGAVLVGDTGIGKTPSLLLASIILSVTTWNVLQSDNIR